jgi:hypothetical protein
MSTSPFRGDMRHVVQFYSNEACLYSTVATFVGEGFLSGEPAVVIATEPHTKGILDALTARFIDVAAALRAGDFVLLDAEATLAALMAEGAPSRAFVIEHLGAVIERSRGGRKRAHVRVYGEMVDLLWNTGRADAALELEMLWNDLASQCAFSLLCGYSMGNFYKQTSQFDEICTQHTHVIGADSRPPQFEPRRSKILA